jgi:flagellar hook-basal body complex protein FliE
MNYALHFAGTAGRGKGEYEAFPGPLPGPGRRAPLLRWRLFRSLLIVIDRYSHPRPLTPLPKGAPMNPISAAAPITLTQATGGAGPISAKKADFTKALNQALEQVSLQQNEAQGLAQRFQLGDPDVSLEKTMVALQTSNISFQALVQVRNRVVAAYQDIMNMQV